MNNFVLDCSMTMAWCFQDEADQKSELVLDALKTRRAIVPQIWPLEVANVLLMAERRKRLSETSSARFLELLMMLPIVIDDNTALRARGVVLSVARQYTLTVYDAAYLDLAMRLQLPLATRDQALKKACKKSGVLLM